jgi:phosphonopyruvate decarboxylase
MISCAAYCEFLTERFTFFTGVPDSLLKSLCACLRARLPKERHITAANEGNAAALAAGHYLATGRPAVVYMQNSGLGNAVNPLLSLCDPLVFGVPLLLLVGWRGEPGIKDEPQHAKQGLVTLPLLGSMRIEYGLLPNDDPAARAELEEALRYMMTEKAPFAFVVKKDTFGPYHGEENFEEGSFSLSREAAVDAILDILDEKDLIVATTGMASRELFELREKRRQSHARDFLCVGSMGHASQIAAAIALEKTERRVVCLDGDGAALMHMGGLALIGTMPLPNFIHIVLNNGAHDSVGGQPTAARNIDLCKIALACGYKKAVKVEDKKISKEAIEGKGPIFIEMCVRKGNRPDLGRPRLPPRENKAMFMEALSDVS